MTTATTVDTRDMVVVHDSIRRQFGELPRLVRDVEPGDTARTAVVADHIDLLGALLHHHHEGEDRLLWPVLATRVPADVLASVQRMEDQHEGIADAQRAVTGAVSAWRAGAGVTERDALAEALEGLVEQIIEHLGAEEEHILPLAAAHMTPAEWHRLGEEGIGSLPKKQLPLVFGMIMHQADPAVIRGMLASAPLVPRMLMPLLAPRAYTSYARTLYGSSTS